MIILVLVTLILFASFHQVLAQEVVFSTDLEISYTVSQQGWVEVTHRTTLTNLTANQYSTEYHLEIQGRMTQVSAADQFGALIPETTVKENSSLVIIPFKKPVVGEGKTRSFYVAYTLDNLLERNGEVWEINLPPLAKIEGINKAEISLTVPYSIGPLAYMTPDASRVSTGDQKRTYYFTKDQIQEKGISAAFGECQIFDFELRYHLQNPYAARGLTRISLPPDTAYQQIYLKELKPSPTRVYFDPDGNLMAEYELKRQESYEVRAQGSAILHSQPRPDFPHPDEETLDKNLRPQTYWETDHPQITELAANLKTVRSIYDYVVAQLTYDTSIASDEIKRKGAVGVLADPEHALCMEFTDLFIALCRAAGIPAREAIGYAYTNKTELKTAGNVIDILHSWPEYWDEERKLWVPVDPTWENTTLGRDYFQKMDLNHFVFTYHGVNSQEPIPAGSYKTGQEIGKDIQIQFGSYPQKEILPLTISFSLPKSLFKKSLAYLELQNPGPTTRYNSEINLLFENIQLKDNFFIPPTILTLAPYEKKIIILQLSRPKLWEIGQAKINARIGDTNLEYRFRKEVFTLPWLILATIFLCLVIGYIYWRFIRHKKTSSSENDLIS